MSCKCSNHYIIHDYEDLDNKVNLFMVYLMSHGVAMNNKVSYLSKVLIWEMNIN